MQTKNLTMCDYAKNRTVFVKDFERMRKAVLKEAWSSITPQGWLNIIFHVLAGKSFNGNWN